MPYLPSSPTRGWLGGSQWAPKGSTKGGPPTTPQNFPRLIPCSLLCLLGALMVPNEVVLGTRAHALLSFLTDQGGAGWLPVRPQGELQGGAQWGVCLPIPPPIIAGRPWNVINMPQGTYIYHGKTPGSLHPWLSMALYFPPIGSIGGVREVLIKWHAKSSRVYQISVVLCSGVHQWGQRNSHAKPSNMATRRD